MCVRALTHMWGHGGERVVGWVGWGGAEVEAERESETGSTLSEEQDERLDLTTPTS